MLDSIRLQKRVDGVQTAALLELYFAMLSEPGSSATRHSDRRTSCQSESDLTHGVRRWSENYAELVTADLQAVHERVSLLSSRS